ncbi:proteoglycan 4 isoform X2 [Drosophila miranda]|uniref:proteoglycan 4 isoform X2 n=1 Tax=Drosophila miranda TaxID=7229 RepID=UPI0007E694F8|nr:proteoglycan 4 isoform X2 [Drosophila miranda]
MAASLICVDISSESEDESPPGAKRRRLEKPRNGTAKQNLPQKLANLPKSSVSGGGGVGGKLGSLGGTTSVETASTPIELHPLKPMHIPSGITITKHGKNATASSNGMVITSIASMHEFNNNSNIFNNNNKNKPQKTPMAQKAGWPPNSKPLGQSIMITSVPPNHQVKPATPTLPVKIAPGQQVKLTTAQQVKLSPIHQVKPTPTSTPSPNLQAKPALGYQAKPTPNFQVQQTSIYRMKGTPLPGYQMMALPINQARMTPTNQLKPMPSNQITVSAVAPKPIAHKAVAPNPVAPKPVALKTIVPKPVVSQQHLVTPQKQLPLAAGPPKNQLNSTTGLQEKTTVRLPQQKMTLGQMHQHLQQQKKQLMAQQLQQAILSGSQYQTQRVSMIQQQQKPQPASPPAQKPQVTQKPLPTLQKAPAKAGTLQMQQKQQPQQMQRAPPPAHLVQKKTPPPLQMISSPPPPAHSPAAKINPPAGRASSALQITPVPRVHPGLTMKQVPNPVASAARTLPYKSSGSKSGTPPMTSQLQSFTASSAPPQRLLATPPHCPASLNEPLLVNLPPTTSITPQLTPTTTPPPAATALQHQQLPKGSAFKLNSLPGASISPVPAKPANNIKRIQPITVLKKSDEDWRRHLAQQQLQNQQQLQMQQRQRDQRPATPTIVLVESPPTTPPTEKQEMETRTNHTENALIQTMTAVQKKPIWIKPAVSRLNSPTVIPTPLNQVKKATPPAEIVVDLDELPETTSTKQPSEKKPSEKQPSEKKPTPPREKPAERDPFVPEYAALLKLCAETDKSKEMTKLIETKLTKYYYSVHESFVRSRGFRKLLESAMERIKAESDLVYMHLSGVVDELKARRKAKVVTTSEPEPEEAPVKEVAPINPSTRATLEAGKESKQEREQQHEQKPNDAGQESVSPAIDKRTDERIRRMNIALHRINKRIQALENSEVDWDDDDNSSYLTVERYKKRACEIYEKICDLTGESKSAFRQLKQPIRFEDSPYPQFNRMLSSFVNRMQEFPDYHDVLQLLEHCNKMNEMGLATFEMKLIASDAFLSVGRLLQSKRKRDLYETANHFTGSVKDPAATDPELMAKLKENTKKHTKISDVLAKYSREQDLNADNMREARLKKQKEAAAAAAVIEEDDDKPCTSAQAAAKAALLNGSLEGPPDAAVATAASDDKDEADNDDEEEDSESEEEEEEDLDDFVEKFKTNGDISDADSEIEAETLTETATETTPKTDAPVGSKDVIDITRDETADSDVKANPKSNSKPNDVPPNGILKIISVSSLNASVINEKAQAQKSKQSSNALPKRVIAAEIIISDEES